MAQRTRIVRSSNTRRRRRSSGGSLLGTGNAPTISSLDVTSGSALGTTAVIITGTNFREPGTGATTITFGGSSASAVMVLSDTAVSCLTPAGTGGSTVDVVVQNANGSDTLVAAYTYFPTPTVSLSTPNTGTPLGNEPITITGTGFTANSAGTNTATIGGNPCLSVVTVNDTTITCNTPAGVAGAQDVVVSNANGSGTLSGGFTFFAQPTVTSIFPTSGTSLGGVSLTITGTGFTANSAGTNLVSLSQSQNPRIFCTNVVAVSDTTITCDTPAVTAGELWDVDVSNNNGADSLIAAFTAYSVPTVTASTPNTGPTIGGTAITITGSGFVNNSPGTNTVTIGGAACTSVVVVNDTSITCDTPTGGVGPSDVQVVNNNGTGTLVGGFTYTATPSQGNQAFLVTSVRQRVRRRHTFGVYRRR